MRVVFRMSAIVAALAVATSAALTACGQRGPLYLPSVPPLPEKPVLHTGPSAQDSDSGSQASSDEQGHAPLTLAPADALGTAPNAQHPTPDAGAASSPAPDQ